MRIERSCCQPSHCLRRESALEHDDNDNDEGDDDNDDGDDEDRDLVASHLIV